MAGVLEAVAVRWHKGETVNTTVVSSIPTGGIIYLIFSFPFLCNETKRTVYFRHSTRIDMKMGQKVRPLGIGRSLY